MSTNSHQLTSKRIVLGALSGIFGAPYRTRTYNRRLRRSVLYPIELREHGRGISPSQLVIQTSVCDSTLRLSTIPYYHVFF